MAADSASYPATFAARDRFVLERRGSRPTHNPWQYQNVIVEHERAADGRARPTATVFLTGRECPWRCVMCDLWKYTTPEDTPPGAIAAQLRGAREHLDRGNAAVSCIKLYNASSFFDPRAVPEADYAAIASMLEGFDRVVVESHPALIGPRVDRWLAELNNGSSPRRPPPQLEVAMGLETAHPDALERLHKRMTIADFLAASESLARRGIERRVFLLINPPFVPADEQRHWLLRSIDVAFESGASVVSLIPTRSGNGALDALSGHFRLPSLDEIERSFESALACVGGRGRLFVDLWDLERFSECGACLGARRRRLHAMNLEQQLLPPIACSEHEVLGACE
jgi:radical SAM enzyme (TIGR01210 family)